ncbi:MAG: prepilin-type N-terminal cleavage/methylation domain-containing protein [Planctomycetota bacterium]|nr:prepilin-type N-terminal cleavage/methylation domain-containing protein [Planctomycetota bacterium]
MGRQKAFSLVELLIVVVLLGILAAIVLPKFSNASAVARASMLADTLRLFRTQLPVFEAQHRGVAAGYPDGDTSATPTEATFVLHMTKASNDSFQTAEPGTPGFDYGPYMRRIPENPINEKNTVKIIANNEAFPDDGDNSYGWIYQPATLLFKADSPGTDDNGKAYFDY